MNDQARTSGWILPFAALLQLVLFGYFLVRTTIRPPFMDMLAWLVSYLYFKDHGGFGAYLWAFHNEHRLVWIRLLTMIDVELFHTAGFTFIVAGTLSLLAAAAMAGTFIHRAAQESHTQAMWLAPMLILTSASAVDCSIPINTVYPIAIFFVIGSIVLFESQHRVLAQSMAAGAAFGSGAGLVLWPILIWAAWRQRTGRAGMMAIALAGILFIGAYTHGSPSTTPLAAALRSDLFNTGNILKLMDYALAFLGLPFSRAPALAIASRVMGFGVLTAGVFAFVHVSLIERANTKLNRFAVALILFTLGATAMVAISRTQLDPDVKVPVRYAVLVAPLHIGLLCLVIQKLSRRVWIGLAGILLMIQVAIGLSAIRVSDEMRLAIQSYYLGNRDPEVARFVFTDPASAELLTSIVRDRGLLGGR